MTLLSRIATTHRFPIRWLMPLGLCIAAICLIGQLESTGQDAGLDEFRRMHAELRQRMDEDLDEAVTYLEGEIKKAPDSGDVNVLRHSLASKLAEAGKTKPAIAQFQKLLDFQIEHVDQAENMYGVWMTIQSIREITQRNGGTDELEDAVNRSLTALHAVPADQEIQPLIPVSQLTVLKAHFLVEDGETKLAEALVGGQVAILVEASDVDDASEETMRTLVQLLRSLTTEIRENDTWRDRYVAQLDALVSTAIDRFPRSIPLQNDYAETQYRMITEWGQDDPEATSERIKDVTQKLNSFAIANRSVRAILRRIEVHRERMSAAKPVATLVGQPAPEWDIDAWVNTVGVTRKSFEGQVVLLDFWAMWCGPCVATFPHLREWREEFGDQDFEIVGVTQYYNFEWDKENKRASRASEEVSPQQERETLASFLEHHQLEHPVLVNPKESTMGSDYGVRGIPHVVLIDREGVVQLIKTGAGEATANEIHAKIKELVEQKTDG